MWDAAANIHRDDFVLPAMQVHVVRSIYIFCLTSRSLGQGAIFFRNSVFAPPGYFKKLQFCFVLGFFHSKVGESLMCTF